MKFLSLLLFFLFISCANNNKVYMCGDRECVDKKEIDEHFKNKQIVEIKPTNKKDNKKNDLIFLNQKKINNKSLKVSKISNSKAEKKLKKEKKRLARIELKNKRKEQKIRNRQNKIILNNKNKKKIEKKDLKKIVKKTDQKTLAKTIVNNKKQNENKNDVCNILISCDINEIEDYLTKKGKKKDYPNLSID